MFLSCTTKETQYTEAIERYYLIENRSTGVGTHRVSMIEVKSTVKWNVDSTFVLAAVSGTYSPPPLPSNTADENFSIELWYILNVNNEAKVIGIRDPDKFHPQN